MGRAIRERVGLEMWEKDADPMTVRPGEMGSREGGPPRQSMNFVGSTYSMGLMIANGYFGSFTVLP